MSMLIPLCLAALAVAFVAGAVLTIAIIVRSNNDD